MTSGWQSNVNIMGTSLGVCSGKHGLATSMFMVKPPQQGSAICHVFTRFSYMFSNPRQICSL